MSELQINLLFGLVILILLALNIYIRKKQTDRTPIGRVVGIVTDINKDVKIIDAFTSHHDTRKLRAGNWHKNRQKINFLPQEVRDDLANLFNMVDEANGKIEQARKNKSDTYLQGINLERMKAPMAKLKQVLADWLRENLYNPEYMPRRKSLFGDMFRWGRRR